MTGIFDRDHCLWLLDQVSQLQAENEKLRKALDYVTRKLDEQLSFQVNCEERLNLDLSRERERVAALQSALGDWIEYFSAIERGEVGPPRDGIRTLEKTFLDDHRKLLGWPAPSEKEGGK